MQEAPNPLILIDTREQQPLAFPGWRATRATLWAGDYSLRGFAFDEIPGGPPKAGIAIERKSIADLYGTMFQGRERFTREIERLKAFSFRGLVIEGTPADLWAYVADNARRGDPSAIMSGLRSFEVNDNIHVQWAGDREGAALAIMEWFRLFANREFAAARRMQRLLTQPPPVECKES